VAADGIGTDRSDLVDLVACGGVRGPSIDDTVSWSDAAASQQKYYDAAEVEDYIAKVTATIKRLQDDVREQTWRADQAEQQSRAQADRPADPPPASVSQAVSDAETRAASILYDAQRSADRLVAAAQAECARLIDTAGRTAWEQAQNREVRLLRAVDAFAQRSHQLGEDLHAIETEAAEWRLELASATSGYGPPPSNPNPDPPVSEAQEGENSPPPPRRSDPVPSIPRWPTPTEDPYRPS
jgi:cell division septum initiation protein DivIVA